MPVEKPKTSHADKKKRKRVRKVDVNKNETKFNPLEATRRSGARPNQGTRGGGNTYKKGGARAPKPEITEEAIQKEIKETLARLSKKGGKSKGAKNRRQKRENVAATRMEEEAMAELDSKTLKLTEFVSVSELASMMDVRFYGRYFGMYVLGIFVSINQRLDAETIQIVAEEFGYEVEFVSAEIQDAIPEDED